MESMVEISSELHCQLLRAAVLSPEMEICGLLFGDAGRIEAVRPCSNVAADSAVAFEIDPAALIAAHRAMRAGGPRLIGHYHSHPRGAADPSPRDAAAAMPGDLWLILGHGEARLWRAVQGGAWLGRFERVAMRVAAPCALPAASP